MDGVVDESPPATMSLPSTAPPLTEPKSLATVLQEAHLSQYESALREQLGASFSADLADLAQDDLIEIGMKKLEAARLLRIAQQDLVQ